MKKNKNSELKTGSEVGVAGKSKLIKKNPAKLENKVKGPIKPVALSHGKSTVKKQPKVKKMDSSLENGLAENKPPVSSGQSQPKGHEERVLAIIEKKRAKKLKQKLKKKEKKAAAIAIQKEGIEKKAIKPDEVESEQDEKTPINVIKERKLQKKLIKKEKIKENKKEHRQRDPERDNEGTVFVGNLPTNTKQVQVRNLFKPYGPVLTVRLRTAGGKHLFKHKDRTQAAALNAYVLLTDKSNAERALELNGTIFKENHLRVTRADANSHNRGGADAKHLIFIGNLKHSTTEESLRDIFSSCGEIDYVRCLQDREKGCKGTAYVCFKSPEAVGLALELNQTMLDERPINVERYVVKKLGAKKIRDAAAEAEKKSATGAKKRLINKTWKLQKDGKKPAMSAGDKKKKTEFRGVKVGGIKKKPNMKKKVTGQMEQLAKKIAPKTLTSA